MRDSRDEETGRPGAGGESVIPNANRRDFLRLSGLTALAAMAPRSPAATASSSPTDPRPLALSPVAAQRSNPMPGRIIKLREPLMGGHLTTPSKETVEQVVHTGVCVLTGQSSAGPAFESLFPGLTSTSKIAIKVNCIADYSANQGSFTRWETVRGIVSGLARMLDGTYDISQVTIFDNHDLPGHGYATTEFTFGGHTAQIKSGNSPSTYTPYGSYRLSSYIVNANYLINVPILKSHTDGNNQITISLKNHYGSCSPSSLCGDITGMLTINADAHIKTKTCLIVTDAIRATYNGGPVDPPGYWNTFPEHTPNTLFFTTDPVTNEYWGRDMINAERLTHGWAAKPCPWIEQASASPFSLGVSNPGLMTVISMNAADAPADPQTIAESPFLLPNVPNPFREGTKLRFRMVRPGYAVVAIADASGRLVRDLGGRAFPVGDAEVDWDGRDGSGRRIAPGVYFARIQTSATSSSRGIVKVP
jgi:hypothetical protein